MFPAELAKEELGGRRDPEAEDPALERLVLLRDIVESVSPDLPQY